MTIREMCDTFEVTPRTLRFYEAKELLFPIRDGQRRLFTRRDRARLKLILKGKGFGFALEDMRQILDLYHVENGPRIQMDRMADLARRRLAEMRSERDALDTAISALGRELAGGGACREETCASAA